VKSEQDQGVAASPPLSQPPASAPDGSSQSGIANAVDLTRDERSFLLYAETCCVDGGGLLVGVRMNADDLAAAESFVARGVMIFGRIPAKMLGIRCDGLFAPSGVTHYVELTDIGWRLAHQLRQESALRRGPYATAVFAHDVVLERTARQTATEGTDSNV
jgi:hypothetical protein